MANTSKYIQLSNQILMEYIYGDQTIGSPDYIETDNTGSVGARVQLMDNAHTGQKYLFTEENPKTDTGNYRRYSVAQIDDAKFAWLTTSIPLNYIDYDTALTDTAGFNAQLEDTTSYPNYTDINDQYKTGGGVLYDSVRLHLMSGYDISQNYDGFIFQIKFRDRLGVENVLSSIAFLNQDNYDKSNPAPFILGERLYSSYIDLKIPSLNWIIDDYISDKTDNQRLGYVMTGGVGFAQASSPGPQIDGTIICELKFISKTTKINGFTYFETSNDVRVTLNKTDEYNLLAAYIGESPEGDYFEVYGKYNGIIYEDFIAGQNANANTDLVVIHDLSVYEQVGTTFLKTTEQSFVQSGDFGVPYNFRPVIKNSHVAVSYRIDYIMRLFNKFDNSQIIKRAQYSSFNVKKYGKKIQRINLGSIPTVSKVYNTILDETGQAISYENQLDLTLAIPTGKTSVIKETQYVLGFKERINVSAAISNVQNTPAVVQQGDVLPTGAGSTTNVANAPSTIRSISSTDVIYGLGEGAITIAPFDNYILFIFYEDALNLDTPVALDLTNCGDIYLNFKSPNGDVKIKSTTNIQEINVAEGEVLFKIKESDAKKIMEFTDATFYVTSKLSNETNSSDETMLYHGKWYLPNQKYDKLYKDIIKQKDSEIKVMKEITTKTEKTLNVKNDTKDKTIRELEAKIATLQAQNTLLIQSNSNNIEKILQAAQDTATKVESDKASSIVQNKFITDSDRLSESALDKVKGQNVNTYNPVTKSTVNTTIKKQ